MMFLIRTAFWLLILVLLLPADKEQQEQIYGTAQAAMNDVAGFCDRNPQTCAMSQDAFSVLVQKAQYGAQMVMAFVEGQTATMTAHQAQPAVPGNSVVADGGAVADTSVAANGGIMEDGSVMPVPAAVPLEPMPHDQAMDWSASPSQDTLRADDRATDWAGPGV